MTTHERPVILLITLDLWPSFDDCYRDLLDQITAKATLKRASTAATIHQALSENPQAVLIPNNALAQCHNALLWDIVLDHIELGGTAICMGYFARTTEGTHLNRFFAKAGLPWTWNSYFRATSAMKVDNVPREIQPVLPATINIKTTLLAGADPGDAWYELQDDEFCAFSHLPVIIPIAMAKVGDGRLGYVGDAHATDASRLVVVAMCGLFA